MTENYVRNLVFNVESAVKAVPVCRGRGIFRNRYKLAIGRVANEYVRSTASAFCYAASKKIIFTFVVIIILNDMSENNFFLKRKTVRRYTKENISDELIAQMLTEASHAPTTGNMQLYSVVTTRTPE